MTRALFFVCLALLVLVPGCVDRTPPSSGQVFAGPADLALHQDVNPRSKVVAHAHHGEKLDVVQQRRRLFKLRTSGGLLGWTDERNLMSAEQMKALAQLEDRARRLASQGVATSYEILNVHTLPQRYSPSFFQIREGEKFDVLSHESAPRAEPVHHALVKPQPKAPSKKNEKKKLLQIPPPRPPKPPDDWVELSQEREPPPDTVHARPETKEPVPEDDWTLVRTPRGAAGWVLTSRIYLAIPDEVAQYAEGHRITTYFSLGKVHDSVKDVDKDVWLWTTVTGGQHPYDFDSFRVFTWSLNHHRYETAYIQRRVEGYLPVVVVKSSTPVTFSICLADDDGNHVRTQYELIEHQVKKTNVQPCKPEDAIQSFVKPPVSQGPAAKRSLSDRLKEMKGRLFGK